MKPKCWGKFFIELFPEKDMGTSIIAFIAEPHELVHYKDGRWVEGKSETIKQISPQDPKVKLHYMKAVGEKKATSYFLYECGLCGKDFKERYALMRHLPIHTRVKNFACEVCNKKFRQQSTLLQHKVTHDNNKSYKCSTCDKSFKRFSTLRTHKITHTDEKKFKCDFCGKGFHQKINMINHRYTHTGTRPYKCKDCGRGFNQQTNLSLHERTHSLHKNNETPESRKKPGPNPFPNLHISSVLNVERNKDGTLGEIVQTVVKDGVPEHILKKIQKNETFALYIENDFKSPKYSLVKLVAVEKRHIALVTLKYSDYNPNEHVNAVGTVLRESLGCQNYRMFFYVNETKRHELSFCDGLRGININEYKKSQSMRLPEMASLAESKNETNVFDILPETEIEIVSEEECYREISSDSLIEIVDLLTDSDENDFSSLNQDETAWDPISIRSEFDIEADLIKDIDCYDFLC